MTPNIEILLSTYNGADFLTEFLESLLKQEFVGWRLLVRDDGSKDNTLKIIEEWMARLPEKIRLLDSQSNGNVGTVRSFSTLLEASRAPYVMFADQDDVWLPKKVSETFSAMLANEGATGRILPTLVHTDLTVVDADRTVLASSLWRSQGVSPYPLTFSRSLVENSAWGCTQMLNRALVDRVGSIPPESRYHDWWITLTASAFGQIVPLRRTTILYRRHGQNESDISRLSNVLWHSLASPVQARHRLQTLMVENTQRANVFLMRHQADLRGADAAAARSLLRLPEEGPLSRRLSLVRNGLLFSSALRNAGLLVLV